MFTSEFRLGRFLFGSTFLAVGTMTLVSLGATHYLATAQLGSERVPNAAQRLALGGRDPETTGSVRTRANATRLDPCAAAARFPAAP